MLAVGINGTAIMAALPTMRAELQFGASGVQWAINAYLVVSGACIVLGGAAGDRFGTRRTAMVGLAIFAFASSIIAVAGDEHTLLAARALQGSAAALAVPSTLADLRVTVPPERHGAAIGAWTGFLMLGFSLGPLLGGALTDFVGWRWIFWLNVALILVALAGLRLGAPATRPPANSRNSATDWLGFALLATFMVSLAVALHALPDFASAAVEVVGAFALAAAALCFLLKVERRAAAPLFDVRFFTKRAFATGVVIASLSMFSIMSMLLYYNLYAQSSEGLRLTALQAGLSLLPLCVGLLLFALSASTIAARLGARAAIAGGMLLLVIGSAAICAAVAKGGSVLLALGLFVFGAGLAIPYAIGPRLGLSALSAQQAGQGSGMVNACTFLGGSIGVGVGAIAFAWSGFIAVLAMLGLAGILGIALGRLIPPDS
jgi:MFS family permease